jgi:hypothetical protein
MLVFVYDGRVPIAIAKFGRTTNDVVEREVTSLRRVATLTEHTPIWPTVEKLTSTCYLPDGRLVALKKPGSGVPALRHIGASPRRAARVVHEAVTWLIQFQLVTEGQSTNSPQKKLTAGADLNIDAPSTSWWSAFAHEQGFVLGPAHGDLLLSNMLVDHSRLSTVIDFENFRSDGLPFADLLGLLVTTSVTFLGQTQQAIDEMFIGDTWTRRMLRDEVVRYGRAFDISLEAMIAAMPIYADRALDIARRWDMPRVAQFHRALRDFLTTRGPRIAAAWR